MKTARLEIIRLTQNDVISTSAANCRNAAGVAWFDGYWQYSFNNTDDAHIIVISPEMNLDITKKYHVDASGNVLNEECPCSDTETAFNDYHHSCCLAEGTTVTVADGSSKKIEDIKIGDSVMTFNHESGEYEEQRVYFVYASSTPERYFTLKFEDGTELSIAGEHDLFEKESRRYVTIRMGNAKEFIGKHFYSVKEKKYVELMDVTYSSDTADYYSIYTKYNFNSIANGMLTCPDDVDVFLNFYELDENMIADKEALKKDIEKYGLREYEATIGMSEKEFEETNIKYIKIMIGKGLTTKEKLLRNLAEVKK